MTSACCSSSLAVCRVHQFSLDRTLHCTDLPLARKSCSLITPPNFCLDDDTGLSRFKCCDGTIINPSYVQNQGHRDCPGGEDERMKFYRCADLDDHDSHFNFLIIPLIVLFVVMACCWRYRRLRRAAFHGNNRAPVDSSSSFDPDDNALNQVGPGWVVGSLPQAPADSATVRTPTDSYPPSVSGPPPYSETTFTPSPDVVTGDPRSSNIDLPPSYDEAVKWKN